MVAFNILCKHHIRDDATIIITYMYIYERPDLRYVYDLITYVATYQNVRIVPNRVNSGHVDLNVLSRYLTYVHINTSM